MIQVRKYKHGSNDYDFILECTQELGHTPPPEVILPFGNVVYDIDTAEILGVGFLYTDETTPVSVIEWVYVKPSLTGRTKYMTISMLYGSLEYIAKCFNKPYIMTATRFTGVKRLLEKHDYITAETGFSHLLKLPDGGAK